MNATLIRHAVHIAAILGFYLSGAMLIPALIDLYYGHADWQVFGVTAFMIGGLSATTFMATRSGPPPFSKKFGFLLVNVLWLVFSVVGAIPLWLSSLNLDFAQALFESVSAATTTGSTVIVGLDDAPPGILLWRSLLCWLGGIGIVVLGLFIIPYLRVGGMSFFKMESSDISDKPFARIASFSRAFLVVYVTITLLCAIGYNMTGMNRFDAINHAMSTVATGGFSTHDASFGYFGSIPLLWTSTFFMTVCSLPFSILIVLVVRGRLDALRDPQIIVFLGYLTAFSVSVAIYHRLVNGVEFDLALAHSFFNITSILSTSGYASEDYTLWGPFVVMAAFIATFIGGCSGSTAGGIKAYRFVVLFNAIRSGLNRLVYPNAIYAVRYGDNTVDADTQRAIFLFFITYVLLWVFGSLMMGALGYDLVTAVSAVITCLSNVGPGLGSIVGPAGNFSTLQDPELYLLSLMMLLGRLEVLTVLVILTPIFWKH
ncbi:TrkH family potassium uptake protein [Sinorhizobium numidicum]|uniref:Trk system potassium uptake protein n=1 Tax=Sinorhizobium numidicum TaxID=680248 RepID=A0ABY8CUW7_9HYPH|nr:TrkH family potassium uptake protein [Sinorhizobium numidicum]WEX79047.1 TrkH family potassium uptake protein [Sinorhizobium numidicum]WEX82443.1 TrkH family potassium uptake protein [Sinorhizobium numidicum]